MRETFLQIALLISLEASAPQSPTKWRTAPLVISNDNDTSQRLNIGNRIFSPLPTQIQQKQILGAFLKKGKQSQAIIMWGNGRKQVVTRKVKSVACLIHSFEILHNHDLGRRNLNSLILSSLNNISSNIKLFCSEQS